MSAYFQASVPPGGKVQPSDNEATITLQYEKLSLQGITDFYENEFKGNPDIDWNELHDRGRLVLYDWGNKKWHKIDVVDKGQGAGTLITITKDSWTWIVGTLVIRFVGVFIVLIVLMIALYISGRIFSLSGFGNAQTENKKA